MPLTRAFPPRGRAPWARLPLASADRARGETPARVPLRRTPPARPSTALQPPHGDSLQRTGHRLETPTRGGASPSHRATRQAARRARELRPFRPDRQDADRYSSHPPPRNAIELLLRNLVRTLRADRGVDDGR